MKNISPEFSGFSKFLAYYFLKKKKLNDVGADEFFKAFVLSYDAKNAIEIIERYINSRPLTDDVIKVAKKVATLFGVELEQNSYNNIILRITDEKKDETFIKNDDNTYKISKPHFFDFTRGRYVYNQDATTNSIEKHRLFKIGSSINESYPTVKPDATRYDNLSLNDIMLIFGDSKKFNNLDNEQICELCQALSNKFLDEKFPGFNIKHCKLEFGDLGNNPEMFTFGEHFPAVGKTVINSNIFEMVKKGYISKDQLAAILLETTIHETEHRAQFQTIGNKELKGKNLIVSQALLKSDNKNQNLNDFYGYINSLEELDARDAALGLMKEFISKNKGRVDNSFINYYNSALQREQQYQEDFKNSKIDYSMFTNLNGESEQLA